MVRLTLILTVMLAVVGLPEALKPLLFQSGPRLVILTTGEEPHVLNPEARQYAEPPFHVSSESVLLPTTELDGPQLSHLQPYAEQLIIADGQS
ncbi:MAG: hypothetical protein GYB41_06215 [Oceanospirillales bacterium]|uniref:Uncharacterized protein n=1 Tax=Marinobacterium halophilum TaxID=267374 RepID=A0A2P8ES53_9GAMM|nr:hypothetical protein [Marinobacterium halophilum]MBR9828221.1 hypothetical protein [Oceanospirillales bacterium]PSL12265.1 hypothetical protein CLV44_119100 [Marinobacterium halophilum]